MASGDSIELFQFIKKYYDAIGINKPESNHLDWHFFNSTNWILILSAISMLISSIAFLLFQAKTTYDFGWSFLYSLCLFFGGIFYVIFSFQIKNISIFIKSCEIFIQNSKLMLFKIVEFVRNIRTNLFRSR